MAPADYPGHIVQFCGIDEMFHCPCGWELYSKDKPQEDDSDHYPKWSIFMRLARIYT